MSNVDKFVKMVLTIKTGKDLEKRLKELASKTERITI